MIPGFGNERNVTPSTEKEIGGLSIRELAESLSLAISDICKRPVRKSSDGQIHA